MKWYSTYNHPDKLRFIIEHDENLGYFIYHYSDFECFEEDVQSPEGCPHHQDDYLQDTFEIAKSSTEEDFGVPIDSWVEAKPA